MRIIMNGQEREIPSDNEGNVQAADVRRAANVPDGRAIIMQRPTGENFVMPQHGKIANPYGANFIDAPTGRRGML